MEFSTIREKTVDKVSKHVLRWCTKNTAKCSDRVKVSDFSLAESRWLVQSGRVFRDDISREQPG